MTEPETTFRYAAVEQALMAVQGFGEHNKGAFRARLVHFQRLKIVAAAPGKGHRIAYRREDIYRWAVALEFAQFGMDPTDIRTMLNVNWVNIAPAVLNSAEGSDRYLFFHPNLLGRLSPPDERETSMKPGAPYNVSIDIISELADLGKHARTQQQRSSIEQARARYGMINLSRLRRMVEENLAAFSPMRA